MLVSEFKKHKPEDFKFFPDLEDGGLVIEIPNFGPWWVDQSWEFEDIPLDELPTYESFCDEAFANRLNLALDKYIFHTLRQVN